jgi:hypothetical protein
MLLYRTEKRRQRRARADLIEDIGFGYAGCRSDEGMQLKKDRIEHLRRE